MNENTTQSEALRSAAFRADHANSTLLSIYRIYRVYSELSFDQLKALNDASAAAEALKKTLS